MNVPLLSAISRVGRWGRSGRSLVRLTLALGLSALLTACNDGAGTPTVRSSSGAEPTQTIAPPPDTATMVPNTAAPTSVPTASPTTPPTALPTAPELPQFATPTDPPAATLSDSDTLLIYNLIAHDLVSEISRTSGGKPPAYIGINPHPGKGELLDTDSAGPNIPTDLVDNMADLGTTVAFAPFMEAIGSLDNGGKVRDDGIYLTLGLLQPAAGNIQTYASLYRARDNATGYHYMLQKPAGGPWTILQRQVVWDH